MNSYDCGSVVIDLQNTPNSRFFLFILTFLENGKICNFSLTSGKVDSMFTPFFPPLFFFCVTFPDIYHIPFYSSWLTLFLPLRLNPYTDGYAWARKDGYDKHLGILKGEELTDEDDDDL